MRVVALVSEAFGGFGGIALYNRDLLTALCELPSCERVTVLPRLLRGGLEPMPAKLDYREPAANGFSGYLLQLARLLAGIRGCDMVVCGHINLLPLAELVRHRYRVPLVLVIYGIDAWQPTGRRLTDRLAGRADAVITISELTGQRFLAWTGLPRRRLHVLPNAVRPERYGVGDKPGNLLQRYGLAGSRVIMTMGRLSAAERYKGVDEVLELFPGLVAEQPALRYLIVGEGDDRDRLERKAAALGVGRHVVFAGRIPEAEKADHYRLADAFVMAGRGEGFGFVFLEAMACGVPVVASRLDGSQEAVRGGALGLLADPDNRQELKARILEALERPRLIPGGLEYFSFANFGRRVQAVVDAVLSLA